MNAQHPKDYEDLIRKRYESAKQQAYDNWAYEEARRMDAGAHSVYYVGVDPAKPGSDSTVIYESNPSGYNCFRELWERARDAPIGTKISVRLATPVQAPAVPEKLFDTDHAWDMLVLAARTSRYSE